MVGVASRFVLQELAVLFRLAVSLFSPPKKQLHTDRFALPSELADITSTGLDGASLLMGMIDRNHILCIRPTEKRRELGNILVDAPTRGGKGILAEPQILIWKYSSIVNDIKGELRYKTAGKKAQDGKVFTIDPNGFGDRYDPFAGRHTYKDLKSAAAQLLYDPQEKDPIFTKRATVMLTQLLVASKIEQADAAPEDKASFAPLPYVQHMINIGLFDVAVRLQKISLAHSLYPNLATKLLDCRFEHANFESAFLIDCWSTLSTQMDSLLSDNVVRCFSGSDFTVEDIMCSEKPITVYLCWSERDLISLSPMVKLVWTSLLEDLKYVFDTKRGMGCKPVLAILDELANTGIPLLHLHTASAVGRGISLWMAIQDPSQLEAAYGTKNAKTIIGNCGAHIRYPPTLFQTAKDISEWLGYTSEFAHSKSLHKGEEFSEGEAETAVHLKTAQEVKAGDDEDIYIDYRNKRPIPAKRIDIRNFPELMEMTKISPPPLLPIKDIQPPSWREEGQRGLEYINPDIVG